MKKILVVGNGFLGNNLSDQISKTDNIVLSTYFSQNADNKIKLDIRDLKSCSKVISKFEPDTIINCSARTDIDFLEKNSQICYDVNSEGVKNLAIVAAKYKKKFIQISTDSVFDGITGQYFEEDKPNPINNYAKSKALAEKYVSEICTDYTIVRTNFYGFGMKKNNLLDWILNNLKSNKKIMGFNDVFFSPVEISNLNEIILDLTKLNHNGILHLASDEKISKFEFIKQVLDSFEFNSDLISEGSIDEINFIAKRPKDTSLKNEKIKKITKIKIKSVKDSLKRLSQEKSKYPKQ
jgi:dTDP-4-dehydrorhamnose reductase